MGLISSKGVIFLDLRWVLVIVAQSQVIHRVFDDENGVKRIWLFFLIDSINSFEDLASNKFIISIYCVDDFSWSTVFMSAIIEAKERLVSLFAFYKDKLAWICLSPA